MRPVEELQSRWAMFVALSAAQIELRPEERLIGVR